MERFVLNFLAILLCLISQNSCLFAQAGNPCCMSGGESLNRQVERYKYELHAKRLSSEPLKNLKERAFGNHITTFEITVIVRSPPGSNVRVGQKFKLQESTLSDNLQKPTRKTLNSGTSVVIVADGEDLSNDAAILCEADEELVAYLKTTSDALKNIEGDQSRTKIFVSFLASDNKTIVQDAMTEIVSNGYEGVYSVRKDLPRELIMQRIQDSGTSQYEIMNYGVLAGVCGDASDAAVLEEIILKVNGDFRNGLEGLMAGYLLLKSEAGLAVLDETKLKATTATTPDGKEIKLPFSETYAALQAMRFLWNVAPPVISKERIQQSMHLLLDRKEFADLVITDLARWKDWSIQDRLMNIYFDERFDIPAIRRAIVRYMFMSSQEEIVTGADGVKRRPEHAVKADEYLKQIEEKDPKMFNHASQFLKRR
jgi:hypothetical protein